MEKFCRDLRRGLLFVFLWLEYGRKNELRVRGGASKLFPFFPAYPSPSQSPQRLFVRCLKVSAPVALKRRIRRKALELW